MKSLLSLFRSTELASIILAATAHLSPTHAFSFQRTPDANLDISQLGRVAVAGDFDGVSLYQWVSQTQSAVNTNGSSSLLSRLPNGQFTSLSMSDGTIQSMCPFMGKDGSMKGVIVGGNFTSIGNVAANGIALFNTTTTQIQPLPGLTGSVAAVYCDQNTSTVYVGGAFAGGNSSNAIAWVSGWTNLPFAGFNGPVSSITKAPNGNIVFGGNFDGLGNTTTPQTRDAQVLPLTSADVTATPSSTLAGFGDPKSIVCKTAASDGPGNTWLLQDNTPGSWSAKFGFGFIPTKLRLYNTAYQGRGTKTWRYNAEPINGIMNFSYIAPTGETRFCDANCPLPQNNKTYQDFRFVNNVGMNSFRIDINEWYGAGGGLAGIELFQDDIYTFAINTFNEPQCAGLSSGSAASTLTGPWVSTPSRLSNSEYLSATLQGPVNPSSAQVVFQPNIKQSGNYSITIFTPGCIGDGTCATRGRVNITGIVAASTGTSVVRPISMEIWQTNNYDKYDEIYVGRVEANRGGFRPTITLSPSPGQQGPLTVVAQRIRANLKFSTGGLNGIYEYNPNMAASDTVFSSSVIDMAGMQLGSSASINALATSGNTVIAAGQFSANGFNNIFSITDKVNDLGEGGLNGVVSSMVLNNSVLYMAGGFTGTRTGATRGLSGVASYNLSTNNWAALGAGVDGTARFVVPFQLNLTSGNRPELAIAVSGNFDRIFGFGANKEHAVNGFAVWVPGRSNWLQNLNLPSIFLQGILTAGTTVSGSPPLFAGRVQSFELGANGAFELSGSGNTIQQFPLSVSRTATTSATRQKRAVFNDQSTGVMTGLFYNDNNFNLTVYGGHFSATASNGSTLNNLAIINGKNNDQITGLVAGVDASSRITALGSSGTQLFAGGRLSGNVHGRSINGIVVYDLVAGDYTATQPASLQANGGATVTVNAIAPQPSTSNVFVGGSFDSAGSFTCPSLCVFDSSRNQWNSPGSGLTGAVAAMSWVSNTQLVIIGNLTVGTNVSTVMTYDSKAQVYSSQSGPRGILSSVTAGSSSGDQFWVAGSNPDGSALLQKYNGSWAPAQPPLGPGSAIQGLQVFTTTSNHASTSLLERSNVLMVLGQLNVPNFGRASAAIYNGTAWTPYALTGSMTGSSSLNQVFVEKPFNFFKGGRRNLAVGYVVLIGLAISLAIIFLLVVFGILAERYRRRRDGYMPAPTAMPQDKVANIERVPPEHLFGSVGPGAREPPL